MDERSCVSVLLPTRGRTAALRASVASLRATATYPFEILFWCDHDDARQIEVATEELRPNDRLVVGWREGYTRMHVMLAQLAALARGDWLLIWNDDARMHAPPAGPGWTEVASHFDSRRAAIIAGMPFDTPIDPDTSESCFPLVSRRYLEIFPQLGRHPAIDSYLCRVARRAGRLHFLRIAWTHEKPVHDVTSREEVSVPWTEVHNGMVAFDALKLLDEDPR